MIRIGRMTPFSGASWRQVPLVAAPRVRVPEKAVGQLEPAPSGLELEANVRLDEARLNERRLMENIQAVEVAIGAEAAAVALDQARASVELAEAEYTAAREGIPV